MARVHLSLTLCLLAMVSSAGAANIRVVFEGSVTDTQTSLVSIGDPIVGTYTINADAPCVFSGLPSFPFKGGESCGYQGDLQGVVSIGSGIYFNVDGTETNVSATVRIGNDIQLIEEFGPPLQPFDATEWTVQSLGPPPIDSGGGMGVSVAAFGLQDFSASTFDGVTPLSLITEVSLDDFPDVRRFELCFSGNPLCQSPFFDVTGQITHYSAVLVPVPASLGLFGLALSFLGVIRRYT